jgi:hypothetical protein
VNELSGTDSIGPLSDQPLSIHIVGALVRAKITYKGSGVEAFGRGVERVQGISYCISQISRAPAHDENTPAATETTPFLDDTWNDVVFDDFDAANLDKRVWCAPIFECEKWTETADATMRVLGLLLEEVGGGAFRRVGAFSVGYRPDQDALKRLPAYSYTVV